MSVRDVRLCRDRFSRGMVGCGPMTAKQDLEAMFEADQQLRDAEVRFLAATDAAELAQILVGATEQALAHKDVRESVARLVRLADLCAQVQGQNMAENLIHILNHEDPQVRVAAGEALRDFAYDRYAEVAHAVERAYERNTEGPALEELPWILAEIGEPSAVQLIARALRHSNADVVAAGIEALAELGDPEAIAPLKALTSDPRVVQLDEGEASHSSTLGELAREALGELSED